MIQPLVKRNWVEFEFPKAYHKHFREQVKADNPDIKPTDISKKMGEMWAELEDEDKEEYVEEAEKLKAEYLEKKEKWEDEMKVYVAAKAASSS